MRSTVARWLPAITKNPAQSALLGAAGLAIVAATALGASPIASASAASSTAVASAHGGAATGSATTGNAAAGSTAGQPKPAAAPAKKYAPAKQLRHSFMLQPNYYYCGPSATRVALSAHGKVYSEDRIASWLGTTTNGTGSAYDVTRVLNAKLGQNRYHTTEIPGAAATPGDIATLKANVVQAISQGDVVVANVAGHYTDDNGDYHAYEGGHYLAIWGYTHNGNTVKVADSADTVGSPYYTISVKKMANWIATRGYAS